MQQDVERVEKLVTVAEHTFQETIQGDAGRPEIHGRDCEQEEEVLLQFVGPLQQNIIICDKAIVEDGRISSKAEESKQKCEREISHRTIQPPPETSSADIVSYYGARQLRGNRSFPVLSGPPAGIRRSRSLPSGMCPHFRGLRSAPRPSS